MRLDVMDDFGRPHKVDSKTPLAKRFTSKLMPSTSTPPSIVVSTTSGITALAATPGMEAGEGIRAH
jgi:hypothetical protein